MSAQPVRIRVVGNDEDAVSALVFALIEAGHGAIADVPGDRAPVGGPDEDGHRELVVALLDGRAKRVLTRVGALLSAGAVRPSSLLFCGGTADSLELAAERFPQASITRRDALFAAVASLT